MGIFEKMENIMNGVGFPQKGVLYPKMEAKHTLHKSFCTLIEKFY